MAVQGKEGCHGESLTCVDTTTTTTTAPLLQYLIPTPLTHAICSGGHQTLSGEDKDISSTSIAVFTQHWTNMSCWKTKHQRVWYFPQWLIYTTHQASKDLYTGSQSDLSNRRCGEDGRVSFVHPAGRTLQYHNNIIIMEKVIISRMELYNSDETSPNFCFFYIQHRTSRV